MENEQGFLATLLDQPGDEATWLVLTDWLEEHDQVDRAEFLRLQRRLAHPEEPDRAAIEHRLCQYLLDGLEPCLPEWSNSLGMPFRIIPQGEFWLGSSEDEEGRYSDEGPRRRVRMTWPYLMAVTPVTQEQYLQVMGNNPSGFQPAGRLAHAVEGLDTRHHPVEQVAWFDAMEFCRKLGELPAEKQEGRRYRLPTEAEWEYACRAWMTTPFPWGQSITDTQANFVMRPPGQRRTGGLQRTTQVRMYLPSAWGLYDLVGNVWEWCLDWYSPDSYPRNTLIDPQGPIEGERRNARGGAFHLEARRLRCADRSSFDPAHVDSDLGFRVLCER